MQMTEIEFQESFDPALIPALYKNFKDSIQAILELVDNAIDDRVNGKPMVVTVDVRKDRISIVNKGGKGMGPKELENLFIWGLSSKRGKLGRYGQGGKAAMGYLGKSWRISSTKAGEDIEYVVEESDWDDRTDGLKRYKPKISPTIFVEDGVVQIDIWNLKRKINKKQLKITLGNVYRPLIISGEIKIISGGVVSAFDIQLERPEEHFSFQTAYGKISGWLSLLKEGSSLRGGIRCYSYGRLIVDREFFGHKEPTFKASINRLIGEIYISHDITLLMNKTDFDRDSEEWKVIKKEMYKIMDPYIAFLLGEKESGTPTDKELKEAKHAGEVWKEFLKYRNYQQKEGILPGISIDFGQKPPSLLVNAVNIDIVAPDQEIRSIINSRGNYEPATPPPVGATGRRKRTGAYPRPILHSLPEFMRYKIDEEQGEKVIKINTNFPAYKLRKQQLQLYIWETLILEYAKAEEGDTQTVDDYIEEMNEILADFAGFIRKKNIKVTN